MGQNLPSGFDRPSSGFDRPSSGFDRPSSGFDRPKIPVPKTAPPSTPSKRSSSSFQSRPPQSRPPQSRPPPPPPINQVPNYRPVEKALKPKPKPSRDPRLSTLTESQIMDKLRKFSFE